MSRSEWAHGTIVLPSIEFAAFRQAMAQVMGVKADRTFAETQEFWSGLTRKQQSDPEAYAEAVQGFSWSRTHGYLDETIWLIQSHTCKRVLKSEIEWPTNRTKVFRDDNLSLTFDSDKHSVTYSVGENNHAREHADASMLGQAWIAQIKKVRWAHGTGGVVLGNDEYNQEAGYEQSGGGGSYVVASYGYLGAKEAPMNTCEFTNSQGLRVKVDTTYSRGALKGKVVPATVGRRLRW